MSRILYSFVLFAAGSFLIGPGVPWSAAMGRPTPPVVTVTNAIVLQPPEAGAGIELAARELARHLERVLGHPVPVRAGTPAQWELSGARPYAFTLLPRMPASSVASRPVPAGYSIGPRVTWFDPGAVPTGAGTAATCAAALLRSVYAFLENECGIRWFAPGEAWTVRLSSGPLRMCEKSVRVPAVAAALRVRVLLEGADADTFRAAAHAGLLAAPAPNAPDRKAIQVWLRRLGLAMYSSTGAPEEDRIVRLRPDLGLPLLSPVVARSALRAVRQRLATGDGSVVVVLPAPAWDLAGPALYAFVRGLTHPNESLDTWTTEYSLAFGRGAYPVRRYFRFWWERIPKLVAGHREEIRALGWGDPTRGLVRFLGRHWPAGDFSMAARLLDAAFDPALGPRPKKRLEHLVLAHTHARLVVAALRAPIRNCTNADGLAAAIDASRRMADFRREFCADLRCCLPCIAARELRADDAVGAVWYKLFAKSTPTLRLPTQWHFRIDPDGRGTGEKWQERSWKALAKWPVVSADRPWEFLQISPPLPGVGDLANFDGTGWYASAFDVEPAWRGHKVYLVFGPSDDARTVFVNGKPTPGEAGGMSGLPAPFRTRVDPFFTPNILHQVVVVRVTDSSGVGGLRNPVWVCVEQKPEAGKKDKK